MKLVLFMNMLVLVMVQESIGKECVLTPIIWKVSPISYQDAMVSVSWDNQDVLCTDTLMVSKATDNEETISMPIKVSKGEAIILLEDRCKLYTIRLATLLQGENELAYSTSKEVWLPTMLTTISVLSHLAIFSITMDCPSPNNMMVTACSTITSCMSSPVSSYTETYLTGLSSCTLYTFSLDIHNTSMWSMQRTTSVNLQVAPSLSSTTGTVSTYYDEDCDISNTFWTVRICMVRNTAEGVEDVSDDSDSDEYYSDTDDSDSRDYESSGLKSNIENICSFIHIHPDKLETEVRIQGLKPCTQYTFTMFTRHMVGDRRKEVKEENMITEMTKCSGSSPGSSEDAWFLPDMSFTGVDSEVLVSGTPHPEPNNPLPSFLHISLSLLLFLLLLSCLLFIFLRTQTTSLEQFSQRKPQRSEVENLL